VIAIVGDVIAQASSEIATIRRQQRQQRSILVAAPTDKPLAMLTDVHSSSMMANHHPQPKSLVDFLKLQWLDVPRTLSFAAFYGVFRAIQHYIFPPMFRLCRGQTLSALFRWILSVVSMVSTTSVVVDPTLNLLRICAALEQALVSQLVIIPVIYYPLFFSMTGAMQGLTIQETVTRFQSTFVSIMKRNLVFWIPCQFGTFLWVEEPLQIPVLTVLGLIWTVILSFLAGAAKQQGVVAVGATTTTTTNTNVAATTIAAAAATTMATTTATSTSRGGGGGGGGGNDSDNKSESEFDDPAERMVAMSLEDTTALSGKNVKTKSPLSLLFTTTPKGQYSAAVSLRSRK
jgi:Mpv17 / PMP22 family